MKDFGLILLDKPVGPTSHHVVTRVRQGTGVRKVGHAGTLDPRASGVLVLCLGAATRLSEYISTASKRYEAVIRFGTATRTYDADGEVVRHTGAAPTLEQIQAALPGFEGEIEQVPPPFSAIKVAGKRAYQLARAGDEVDLGPRTVTVYHMQVAEYRPPDLALIIECSAGTYIRSLAHDLGERLGTGAHLAALRRTKAGPFTLEQCLPLARFDEACAVGAWEAYVRPASEALPDFPVVQVDEAAVGKLRFGHRLPAAPGSSGMAQAINTQGTLVAILEAVEGGVLWHPRKVFLE